MLFDGQTCCAHFWRQLFYIGMHDILTGGVDNTKIIKHPTRLEKATQLSAELGKQYPKLAG